MKSLKFKKIKETRGITLIALVITIIVLLILAGVSIATLTGQGNILENAGSAKEKTNGAVEEERLRLAVASARITGKGALTTDILKAEIEKQFGEGKGDKLSGAGPWTYEGENGSYTIEGSGAVGELKEKTVADLVAGDWVIYESPQGEIPCRVLYDTEYNTTNNTNYGVQIISADTLEDNILLGAQSHNYREALDSYNGAIKTLNDATQNYKNDDFVESVRCVGSLPDNPDNEGELLKHEKEDNCCMGDGEVWYRDTDSNYKKDYEQMIKKNLNVPLNNQPYWLASRDSNSIWDNEGAWVRALVSTRSFEHSDEWMHAVISLWCDHEFSRSYTYGIRPVFKLKNGVKIDEEGDGATEQTAYKLK